LAAVTNDAQILKSTPYSAFYLYICSVLTFQNFCQGKVHVFDLAENKHEPMCDQKVVRKSKLTHVRFNQREPLLLIGDDRGGVLCLKLSPNLRKTEVIRAKEKAAAGAAAAAAGGDAPKKPPPKKKGGEGGDAAAEEKVKTPLLMCC
jgi:hypothetical protein